VLLAVLAVAVIAVVAMVQANSGSSSPKTSASTSPGPVSTPGVAESGSAAPSFDLAKLSGPGRISLADLRGHPAIINFWASWCIPCRAEFPLFRDAQARYAKDGLKIVGITYRDLPSDSRQFARENGATWTLAKGGDGDPVARAYGVRAMPQTFFLDPSGKIVKRYFGNPGRAGLDAEVQALLART
jgi:cytochrome c biogenesis protein CcmG/thiol:disulfide interchange protein DsbE